MEVRYSRRNWAHLVVFVLMFLPFAAIGSMALAEFVERRVAFALLVGLPFATMGLLLGMSAVLLIVGQERLCIDRQGGCYELWAIVRWKRQQVPLAELKRAVADFSRPDREPELELRTVGRSIRFGRGADSSELQRLARMINHFLDDLRLAFGVTMADAPATRPAESNLQVKSTRDALQIRHRGRWNPVQIFEFTVVTMFVGGIVGTASAVLMSKGRPGEIGPAHAVLYHGHAACSSLVAGVCCAGVFDRVATLPTRVTLLSSISGCRNLANCGTACAEIGSSSAADKIPLAHLARDAAVRRRFIFLCVNR